MSSPWTPGPWVLRGEDAGNNYHGTVLLVAGEDEYTPGIEVRGDLGDRTDVAVAELIALAPEMAEAILEWDGNATEVGTNRLLLIANKLRAIGANDE